MADIVKIKIYPAPPPSVKVKVYTQGVQGIQGPKGNQGVQGIQGIIGSQGVDGAFAGQGIQGIQGVQSLQGIQGIQGDVGLQGTQGIQGVQSLQGIQGNFGVQGLQGIQGVQGTQGIQGEKGIQGETGIEGEIGNQGIQGAIGIQGETGADGINGAQGAQGIEGDDGKSAYQIWLDEGNTGTEEDFFDSLEPDPTTETYYTYFPIWAEDSSSVSTGTKLSYGNGDETPDGSGIVIGVDCELYAIGGEAENGNGTTNVAADKNGIQVATSGAFSTTTSQNSTGMNYLSTPVSYQQDDIFNFTVIASSGNSIRTVAWFRVASVIQSFKGPKGDTGEDGEDGLTTIPSSPNQLTGIWVGASADLPGTLDATTFYIIT